MITIEESIPTKNNDYRVAEDVFYLQFNDISFYIEDEDQENFYHKTLCKLFPNLQIEKIFPLNGKKNVIDECKSNIGDKNKIYIVDKDFDDILGKKESISNLFYLNRYSIENYLIEENSILEYIISEKPRLKRSNIKRRLDITKIIEIIKSSIKEIIHLFVLVQKKCSALKNISLSYERFFDFNNGNFQIKQDQVDSYIDSIKNELKVVDKRLKFDVQLKKIIREHSLTSNDCCINHYPGKFIIKMLKQTIESMFGLNSRNIESFSYMIACNSSFDSLTFLKNEINTFLE
ncbi:DUF4435 domain-containing protein [Elizabethkingia miricola]|uniref:DUF4435 domain-containing protein n=1 Tax=Elizabethkingia miricola TaxID=172045 RepID=UPI000999E45F|nr:DUF4435 domain-containing protein [Elizabethkingia miricola]OPC32650.1 hypothetical protein BAX99_10530 [Elizabethkingia miricola]